MSATATTLSVANDEPSGRREYWTALGIDADLFQPDDEELGFFEQTTGIRDAEELKAHILTVQEEAYKICPYPCIRNFNFTKLKVSRLPAYPQLLALPLSRPIPVYLDLGCCFANDPRKAVLDGFPKEGVICSDLRPEFWELGFDLFRDRETFRVPFLQGDIFDPLFLLPTLVPPPTEGRPNLWEITTLTQLQGHVSAIHASSFFHLFNKDQQLLLARLSANLLLSQAGSLIFGSHVGRTDPGPFRGDRGWGHSPQTWREMWEGVLGEGRCEVRAGLERFVVPGDPGGERELLTWSVVLL